VILHWAISPSGRFLLVGDFSWWAISPAFIYTGFTILELSKHFMFDFYHNKLCKDENFDIDLGMSDMPKCATSLAFYYFVRRI